MTQQNAQEQAQAAPKKSLSAKERNGIILVAVVLVIAFATIGVKYLYLDPKTEKNNAELTVGLNYMGEAMQYKMQAVSMTNMPDSLLTDSVKAQSQNLLQLANDTYNKALNGDGRFEGLLKLAENFNLAHAQAGICYYNQGNYKEAINQLEKFEVQGDKTLSSQYIKALADCYTAEGNIEKAVEALLEAAEVASNEVQSPLYLLNAGQLYEHLQNNEEANKVYLNIQEEYPTSSVVTSGEIKKYIERTK